MAMENVGHTISAQAATVQQPIQKQEKLKVDTTNAETVKIATPTAEVILKGNNPSEVAVNKDGVVITKEKELNPSLEQSKKAIEKLNKRMFNSEAIYGIDDRTNRVTIKIVDKESKEVLKELPPEQMLDMIAKIWELAGIMVDEKR